MAVHDQYARLTPYELLLPAPDFADRRFPAIGDEAAMQGVDVGNPAAFIMLGAVQGALAELREDDAPRESAHDLGGVLYFAYHFWRTGGALALAQRNTVRALVTAGSAKSVESANSAESVSPAGAPLPTSPNPSHSSRWTEDLAGAAGYMQLPQHLVWIEEARDGPPESVDGLFWFGDAHGALHLAVVAGIRDGRPGFAVVPVPPQPLDALPEWAAGPAREGGGDFETSLPGAALDGLLGIRTPAEVFKLAALLLRRLVQERPAALPTESSPPPPAAAGPAPSALPHAIL